MQYLYKISSSFDGFTPKRIKRRSKNETLLTYNWKEYFDSITEGDIIFTYFTGPGVRRGIYLISKIKEINDNKKVIGKILRYNQDHPLISSVTFKKYSKKILTRPRGSVYVIPPSLNIAFEDLKREVIISDIDIDKDLDCYSCYEMNKFKCKSCNLFNTDFLIKWENEVSLKIDNIEAIISPFWIIPKQQHWIKRTITEHPISKKFYAFKNGYKYYSKLFAYGIMKAIKNHPKFRKNQFKYLIGTPLSPNKIKNGELNRVSELCNIISNQLDIRYLKNALTLKKSISRTNYKKIGINDQFWDDYYKFLIIKTPNLNNKNVLLIDDVVTDGVTLEVISYKINELYPKCNIYAATAGIMAKKRNMKQDVIKKFSK